MASSASCQTGEAGLSLSKYKHIRNEVMRETGSGYHDERQLDSVVPLRHLFGGFWGCSEALMGRSPGCSGFFPTSISRPDDIIHMSPDSDNLSDHNGGG